MSLVCIIFSLLQKRLYVALEDYKLSCYCRLSRASQTGGWWPVRVILFLFRVFLVSKLNNFFAAKVFNRSQAFQKETTILSRLNSYAIVKL